MAANLAAVHIISTSCHSDMLLRILRQLLSPHIFYHSSDQLY